MPPKKPSDKAAALLDAHVAWTLAQLQPDALRPQVESQIDALMADIGGLKLKELVALKDVQDTALKYASEVKLGGAVPALVGDIARQLYDHKVHQKTRLDELLPDQMFEEFLDKFLELRSLREAIIHESVSNPIYISIVSELLVNGIQEYVANGSKLAGKLPGAKSALRLGKAVVSRARPELSGELEDNLRTFVRKNAEERMRASEQLLLEAFESDTFRQVILDLWDDNKHRTVADVQNFAGKLDIEEGFVIGYEYWQHLRQTDFYRELIKAGIAAFYKAYGNRSLNSILKDIGISTEMMIEEAVRYAPPIIDTLNKKKLLEPMIRRALAPFYESEAVSRILAD